MQLERSGVDVDAHELSQEIEERDRLDKERTNSPLRKAQDAHEIDSSDRSVEQVVDAIYEIVERVAV
jgi:cytidylate kinase